MKYIIKINPRYLLACRIKERTCWMSGMTKEDFAMHSYIKCHYSLKKARYFYRIYKNDYLETQFKIMEY